MAKVLDLPAIPPFSVSETSSLAQRWDKWTNSLDYYIRASGISDQKQKRAMVCRQKTNKPKQYREDARQLEQSDDDSSENECLFTLTAHNVHHRSDSLHMLEIEHIPVQMLIDSGASVNVLDLETYHRLKARKGVQLMPSTLRVYAYGSTTPLNILGTVSGRVTL
ncbi:Retrovirus-related Pol poly [Paramuricea clavata]|uniref:Retrovirus-related Pol poly n=1 Tax=Paramuricea clavata TaxID=317549 RepID=A0A6S7IB30_PARCT|nr:Retrovirus-related Pol poly [Paramuricea clavata]